MTLIYKKPANKVLTSKQIEITINLKKNQEDLLKNQWFKGSRERGLR